ncbi:phage tail length tape measure family protein [Brevundimonas sp. TWP2-3-4b2]|uniref:phage tail length tape measure family protein n=1 Tax=Brevundimonas sp. TWP2-3-4b2 TaxID=2804595 RepID=UPI003CF3FA90
MANGQKSVELLVTARDATKAGLASAESGLRRFAAAQEKTSRRRDVIAGKQAELKAGVDQYAALSAEVGRLGQKMSEAKRPSAALKAEFASQKAAVSALRAQLREQANAYIGMTSSARGSFAAMDAVATGARKSAAAVDAETAALVRNTGALRSNASAAALKGRGAGGDLAGQITDSAATRQGRGPLGLRPFELQNLSYQINDVFTQIASGTPVTQVFAQQFGQIAQIFPKVISGALRLAPAIILTTAALSPFITALTRVKNEAESLKAFDQLLTRSGNGADYTAGKLAALAQNLDIYAGSLKDARTALTEFVGDNVAPEYLERFGRTALDFAKVMKVDVKDAAKTVSDAFSGNADAILTLDDQLNFLTAAERKHIKALRDQGKEAQARTEAFAIFERRYGETAAKMRGPWTQILKDFGAAWGTFVNTVNFLDFGRANANISNLMRSIARLTAMLPGANKSTLAASRATFLRNSREIETLSDAQTSAGANRGQGGDRAAVAAQTRRLALLRNENAELSTLIARQAAAEPGQGLLGPPPAAPDTVTRPPPASNLPNAPADRVTDAERLAKAQADFVAGLVAENKEREFGVTLIGQTERASKIAEAIHAAEIAAAEVRLTLTDAQREAITRTVGATHDAEVAQRAFEEVNKAALELAIQRGEVEARNAFIARSLAEEGLTAAMALYAVRADQLGQEYDFEEAARKRAAAEKAVNDLIALRSQLQDRATFLRGSGDTAAAAAIEQQIVGINERLLAAIPNAIALLRALGGPEAEATILTLQTVLDTTAGIGQAAFVTGIQINDMLANGATDAFDRLAQSIAEGKNVIQSLGDTFRQFAADFLKQIAKMILQQMILNALQSMGGGPVKGGAGSGAGDFLSRTITSLFGGKSPGVGKHGGGLVGASGRRMIPSSIISAATRYHTGGIAGMRPDEVGAVLKRNEEVLTESDPRHRFNGGLNKGSGGDTKIVNIFDPAELLEKALATSAGERVMLNFVGRNSGAFKAAAG